MTHYNTGSSLSSKTARSYNNSGEAYQWLAASEEIANKLNDNSTTGII